MLSRISFILIFFIDVIKTNTNNNNKNTLACTLTGVQSQDPYPSLSQCYKYNNAACCTSVHDDYIGNYVNSLLTTSCLRKYTELEDLLCLGCNPSEMLYINTSEKKIDVCLSYAYKFWNASNQEELNKSTTKYDNCGFKVPKTLESYATRRNYIIPSETFTKGFVDFISKLKIPFYEDYNINLIDDISNSSAVCFLNEKYIFPSLVLITLISFLYI